MLTDDEIYQAIDQVQLGDGTSQSFVLAVGRAIEARVLEKLDDADEDVGTCPWCGEHGVGFHESDPPSDYCGHDPALIRKRS